MSETIMIEHQELTEFGYATKSREVITRSCKCSFLEQELAKLKEENEKLKQEKVWGGGRFVSNKDWIKTENELASLKEENERLKLKRELIIGLEMDSLFKNKLIDQETYEKCCLFLGVLIYDDIN